ncbi:hypothetical protein HWQ46_03180 [Shewanella sp. D64]|uniref:hypothetical protein n=1 Tax=unclassified Shewanella TaxID=196818 RepID=UPI0022BA490E|nr:MULTISPECIES: hypothetical protein [unclassified Shewanella]MEC4724550.1 hypothetical protein [Shewanella sp. D64]MEC4736673.1 hypothetical protein [Shewanella sp. E94]WBJ94657.1 hypothetical protein HWQ47_22820 [Shewanella sp. MTB7]
MDKISDDFQNIADNARSTAIQIQPILNHVAQLMAHEEVDVPIDEHFDLMSTFPVETVFVLATLAKEYSELKCSLVNCLDLKSVAIYDISLTSERDLTLFKIGVIAALNLTSNPSALMATDNNDQTNLSKSNLLRIHDEKAI